MNRRTFESLGGGPRKYLAPSPVGVVNIAIVITAGVWNFTVTKMNSQHYNILELSDVILPACSLGLSSLGLHQEMKRLKLIKEMNCLKRPRTTKIGKSFSKEKKGEVAKMLELASQELEQTLTHLQVFICIQSFV